ncbi:MAG: hypothetical protein IPH78_11130 [Bacteroidetes bacterium]|nr:hypothetical protein [Bacteroidota bacterium]
MPTDTIAAATLLVGLPTDTIAAATLRVELPTDTIAAAMLLVGLPTDTIAAATLLVELPTDTIAAATLLVGLPTDTIAAATLLVGLPTDTIAAATLLVGLPTDTIAAATLLVELPTGTKTLLSAPFSIARPGRVAGAVRWVKKGGNGAVIFYRLWVQGIKSSTSTAINTRASSRQGSISSRGITSPLVRTSQKIYGFCSFSFFALEQAHAQHRCKTNSQNR